MDEKTEESMSEMNQIVCIVKSEILAISIKEGGKMKYSVKLSDGEWYNSFVALPSGIKKGDYVRVTYAKRGDFRNIRGIAKTKRDDGVMQPKVENVDMTGNPADNIESTSFEPASEMSPLDTEWDLIAMDYTKCYDFIKGVICHPPQTDGEFAGVHTLFIEFRVKRRQIKMSKHINKN